MNINAHALYQRIRDLSGEIGIIQCEVRELRLKTLPRLEHLEELISQHAEERRQWRRVEYNLIAHVLALLRKNERDAELIGRAVLQGFDRQALAGDDLDINPRDLGRVLGDIEARRVAGN